MKIKACSTILLLILVHGLAYGEKIKPGKERWQVKTGQDVTRAEVNLNPFQTTVAELRMQIRPSGPFPDDRRVCVVERTVWQVEATILEFKLEPDGDYHVVIADAAGKSLVTEIPKPTQRFIGKNNPWKAMLKAVRDRFRARFSQKERKKSQSKWNQGGGTRARIRGVGFFDFLHGQKGMAPNGIELHPLLSIEWLN